MENDKLNKSEIASLLQILRANVKGAKAAILSRAADLKAAYEIQLDTMYPPSGDPVWNAEYEAALAACEPHIRRIEQRCVELCIGTKFRPGLNPPSWSYGGQQLFKELRTERRRVAHAQIDAKLKADAEEVERRSNQMQLEILSNGFVTDAAKAFLDKLPTIDQLVPPLRAEELESLIEGRSIPTKTLTEQLAEISEQQVLEDE
jgi:hypothetical protein